jgi:alkanesulfonate monooxygenase SsuD/methylene tetrahydromethanopterin reductase-like flavin-dependent oxidoreductase (luciferase family)
MSRSSPATSALLTGNRFTLGVGTGEALNEHVLGDRWPSAEERLEMLEEAVHVIRQLLSGSLITHTGRHYTVDTARLYSVPDQAPSIYMSGFGEKAVHVAARIADGYICVQPNRDFVRIYREAGGRGPAGPGRAEGLLGPGRSPGPQEDTCETWGSRLTSRRSIPSATSSARISSSSRGSAARPMRKSRLPHRIAGRRELAANAFCGAAWFVLRRHTRGKSEVDGVVWDGAAASS